MMRRATALSVAAVVGVLIDPGSAVALSGGVTNFYFAQRGFVTFWVPVLTVPFFLCCAFLLGLQVHQRSWRVNYTRKILALTLYFAPVAVSFAWLQFNSPTRLGGEPNLTTALLSVSSAILALIFCVLCLVEPFRRRSNFLATAFAAIDRPEDRPFTLKWLVTSLIATWIAIVAWLILLPRTQNYLMTALFIAGVGDALAEPVGLRFGRHTYAVRAFGTDRLYDRSLEGSACVFISGVVGVALFVWQSGSWLSNALAMLVIPIAATYAEARSPHTWDQPIIITACAFATAAVLAIQTLQ
jgi:dolichol kinase